MNNYLNTGVIVKFEYLNELQDMLWLLKLLKEWKQEIIAKRSYPTVYFNYISPILHKFSYFTS